MKLTRSEFILKINDALHGLDATDATTAARRVGMLIFDALTDSTGGGEKPVTLAEFDYNAGWNAAIRAIDIVAEQAVKNGANATALAYIQRCRTEVLMLRDSGAEKSAKNPPGDLLDLAEYIEKSKLEYQFHIEDVKRMAHTICEARKSAKNQADGERIIGKAADTPAEVTQNSPSALEEREYEEAKNATDADLDLLCLENDHPDGESDSALPLSLAAERSAARALIEKLRKERDEAISARNIALKEMSAQARAAGLSKAAADSARAEAIREALACVKRYDPNDTASENAVKIANSIKALK